MIERRRQQQTLKGLLARSPVVAILGARLEDPELALRDLRGTVVLDEIQRRPELFPTLRVLVDRPSKTARFLVLGSASPDLLRQSSESLAGRISYHELSGFALDEVGIDNFNRLWLRGGFPRSYLARSNADSRAWRRDFIRTFLERDVPQLGITIPAGLLERFWAMLAHYHGQVWNASEFARSFGVSHHVIRRYLDALRATFMIRVLRPWTANIRKRQVKSPKVYLRDSGVLHSFLDVASMSDLDRHPKLGASWEGFLVEAVMRRLGAGEEQCYFWATHTGAELDLLVVHGRRRYGFEIKRTTAPRITPSMRSALEDLQLTRLEIIHAGTETFSLGRNIRAVAAERLLDDVRPLRR